ncbi:hypothetical protein trd_A0918 (plasmid) [Thermomicrobium roseum DSM 5159]|uniref:Uncharacterized protein n=1 Tax=Thermomicrobium roseum (strain ATCC 27502 / DSM 5159 / P-2) TaxID=309801 RepID=B9L554_THERP|nr:hypothetical protein trd_A0918 [Thermomicrobium roseum DSM 5159]
MTNGSPFPSLLTPSEAQLRSEANPSLSIHASFPDVARSVPALA